MTHGIVMAGLVPAIHVFDVPQFQDVDARDKRGHDGLLDLVGLANEVALREARADQYRYASGLNGPSVGTPI